MSELFDDVTRVVAAPVSRRQALRLIAGALGAAVLSRFIGAPRMAGASECDPENDPLYPHPCADICCRYDYYCASTTLLNGDDKYGICCQNEPDHAHLCSAGDHGWCCDSTEACGAAPFTCTCAAGMDACGDACCDTSAGEFCCDPDQGLCCASGVECCFDTFEYGTCCPEGTECVPISATNYPPGNVCCPADQACIGQCCPDGELCFGNLMCCPEERISADRRGCCPAGFVYNAATDSCCLEGMFCGGVCCTPGKVCRDGTCQECDSGQELCFGTCCAAGTCCFGKCCGAGQVCTGECTTLETLTDTVDPYNGGTLESSDGGVMIEFQATGQAATVRYTSQAQPSHPLPEGAQLLRSFTLAEPPAGTRPQQPEFVVYTMHVRYTEATLAAMSVESETQLHLLMWDNQTSIWVPPFPQHLDRAAEEVVVSGALLTEFALVALEAEEAGPYTVHLALVRK